MAAKKSQSGLSLFFAALALSGLAQMLVWKDGPAWMRRFQGGFSSGLGWGLFALGGLLLFWGWRRERGQAPQPERPARWLEAGGLLLVLLFAGWVRLSNLQNYPSGGFRDEGENGNVAIQIMNGETVDGTEQRFPVYIEHNTQNAAGYFYPVAVSFKLFGISILSVRYVSVFFGILAVAAFWALARYLFGPGLGLFLAACLAALRWHINFSRIGFLGVMTVFLSLPMIALLMKGLRAAPGPQTKRFNGALFGLALGLAVARGFLQFVGFHPGPADVWVGLLMGLPLLVYAFKAWGDARSRTLMLSAAALALAMYSYMAARLFVVLVLLVVLHHLLTQQKPLGRKASLFFLVSLGVLALGVAALVGGSAVEKPFLMALGKLLIAAAAVLQGLFWVGQRERFQGWLRPLGLALGVGLVVAGPLYAYSLKNQKEVAARSYRVSIYNNEEADRRPWGIKLVENLAPTMGMVNVLGDGNPRHNLPNEIMVNPLWAALFGLGIFYALYRWREPRAFLGLALWQVSLVAGYFSIEAPQAYRCISAIPAVLILIGLVLERGLSPLKRWMGRDAALGSALLLLPLLLAGGWYELKTYFVDQPKHPGVWAEFSTAEVMMGRELKALNQNGHRTRGLVRPDWADSYSFRFITYPERNYEYFELAKHVPIRAPEAASGEDFLYLLSASYQPLASVLQSFYPHGRYHEEKHPLTNELLYWSFFVPASDAAASSSLHSGLKGRYFLDVPADPAKPEAGPHWVAGLKRMDQMDPIILFDWTVSPIPGFFSAEWTGSVKAPVAGDYEFHLASNSYGLLEIDGQKVCERPFLPPGADWVQGKLRLSKGKHKIRLRYYEARNYSRLELWWKKPGDRDREVLPSEALSPE